MIDVFTVASPSHFGEVALLARSVAEHISDSRFHWFVTGRWSPSLVSAFAGEIDVTPLPRDSGAEETSPPTAAESAIAIAEAEIGAPLAALGLLQQHDCAGVLFFAPQVVLFSPLPGMVADGLMKGIVLTPILVHPEPTDLQELPQAELRALRQGVFSTSLVGVGRNEVGIGFLHWWTDRSREFVPPPDDHHALRPWLNLAPALFPNVAVVRSPRYGVGRHNLHERLFAGNLDDGFTIDGEPLGFFDFSGYEDGSLAAAIRAGRGDRRDLEGLLQWYREHPNLRDGRAAGTETGADRLP